MAVDYVSLRKENERRYGTDIGRIGDMLLANRYDKRTHFIFELLQNAEDALGRREGWTGSRAVAFSLSATELRISHYGQPFNEADVRGICGIDESTKDITSIGRFGIGFKSVYAFTKRPEIHSGAEAFAIESYVWPVAVEAIDRNPNETIIILPLKEQDEDSRAELIEGLEHLGARALLFLRHVKEISWAVQGGPSGLYIRDDPAWLDRHVRELALMGEQQGKPDVEERWLVFSREVHYSDRLVGHAEIAFALSTDTTSPSRSIQALPESQLVVFFPTVVQTHLGFLVQGPYRTTPSRDNVPPNDRWNQQLARETGELLVDALRWLAAQGCLDPGTFRALPLDRAKFTDGLLSPLFANVAAALKSEPLLPTAGGGYAAATNARLSRTQDLRDLFQPDQLASLLETGADLSWLSSDITADRTPELRQYLIRELGVSEVTPESLLPRLNKDFLESQPDEWIVRLYEFLSNVPAIIPRLASVPLVRLENGAHVPALRGGQTQAFLPANVKTEFPTVRPAICAEPQCRKFLHSLGLTEPDPVDDVIRNLLPKYRGEQPSAAAYEADITRILHAFGTDSKTHGEKLVNALIGTPFVMTIDLGDGSSHIDYPGATYLAAARLKELFAGIQGIRLVDDSHDCLRGEDVRKLLEACGATRYIYPTEVESDLTAAEKHQLRRDAGYADAKYELSIQDYSLRGLTALLKQLPTLDYAAKVKKAELLWEALIELLDRGQRAFSGTYRWQYVSIRSAVFDSFFVRRLNSAAWIPASDGQLQPPSIFLFESLGWRANPFLQSKILFKKPIVEELAKEAGIEPAVLDMLKKLGLTSVTELMARLRVDEATETGSDDQTRSSDGGERTSRNTHHGAPAETPAPRDDQGDSNAGDETGAGNAHSDVEKQPSNASGSSGKGQTRQQNNGLERRFVSYVATHPEDDDEAERDGLSHAERLALEQQAIRLIRSREPQLQVMPAGNKGFDLTETDAIDEPQRWIEVKAMKGSLEDRPVGLSRVQFEFARQHGEQYWLYVVEHAGTPDLARIVKVQNPAGRTGTFTFDYGWIEIADIDGPLQKAS